MGRVEKFRQIRVLKQKYIISFVLFFTLLTLGIYTADFSINSLLGDDGSAGIINVNSVDSRVVMVFMNQKLVFDLEYVSNDLARLRQLLGLD